MIILKNEESKSYVNERVCFMCKKRFSADKNDRKEFNLYHQVRDHCYYTGKYKGAAHNKCSLRYRLLFEFPIVFHKGSTYEYHVIITEVAKKFDGQFEYLGENTKKIYNFFCTNKEITWSW